MAAPRVVTVTRPTELEELLARHGTREQARFFLQRRGQSLGEVEERHHRFHAVLARVSGAIPVRWRRSSIKRPDLPRFLFEPDDVVVVVGQDGLVPNVAKYLEGQLVVGVNPDKGQYDGLLVRHDPQAVGDLVARAGDRRGPVEERAMVEVCLDDGQRLVALNELFLGNRTHQSARYRISALGRAERHSSSGVIVTTGTGATGWARSIARGRAGAPALPGPTERSLAFFVREAFPSVSTGASVTDGRLSGGEELVVTSEMNEDGVVFGDGIEDDRLRFDWGMTARVRVAAQCLRLCA